MRRTWYAKLRGHVLGPADWQGGSPHVAHNQYRFLTRVVANDSEFNLVDETISPSTKLRTYKYTPYLQPTIVK